MEGYAEIEAEYEELEVVAETETCAEGELVEQVLGTELASRVGVVGAEEPHVACVEEECAVEVADDVEPVFGVCLKLDVASLVEVCASACAVVVTARTYGSYSEGAYAVGSAHVEEFAVGGNGCVAVCPDDASLQTCNEAALFGEFEGVALFDRCFEELGVWAAEEFLVFHGEVLACGGHYCADEVTRLLDGCLEPLCAPKSWVGGVVIPVCVLHGWYELVFEADEECGVGCGYGVEPCRCALQFVECECEGCEGVGFVSCGLYLVACFCPEGEQAVVVGSVELVGGEFECG